MNGKSFVELSENIFRSVLLLPLNEENSAEEVKNDFTEKINEFCNCCTDNCYATGEIENAKYALCAWIDEYIYSNCSISAKWFSHSLVLNEFADAEAGKHFFDKMDALHKNTNCDSLMELYAKCILFGFMGKFRMGNKAELKQILNSAVSKTKIFLEDIKFKPATKNSHWFSFRRGTKNILITGLCEDKCKEAAKKQTPPKGYRYVYSKPEDYENLPFIDGIIIINPLQEKFNEKQNDILEKIFSKQKCKTPVYRVADFGIQEISHTLDKNYEFNSNHLNHYLHKNFQDEQACKNILSLPKKLEQFKNSNAFYSLPFFPFMRNEKPLAYSLAKKALKIFSAASILLAALFAVLSIVGKYKEEIKTEAMYVLQKHKIDSIKIAEDSLKLVEDSLKMAFENRLKNLELHYQKHIFGKFPFKEGRNPTVAEVRDYFAEDGEFQKFMDMLDTISDERIKFNKKTLSELERLKNSLWSGIPVSIVVKAPKMASVRFGIDSQYIDVEHGSSKTLELLFPQKTKSGIELVAKTANNVFRENINGQWSLLQIQDKQEFSFADKSYLVDVELFLHWHVPKNSIKPRDWFELRLEPSLIKSSF